jgi:epoxyqueuosine reductase
MEAEKSISQEIKEEALRLGFADCGFSRAEVLPEDGERLKDWLDRGHHAGMAYMANHYDKRMDPTRLVEGAKSVISVLYNYFTDQEQTDPDAPILSKYAFGKDYHKVLKDKLYLLFGFIKSRIPGTEGRVFVDSAPVLDRAWARRAGLGWIGKNSNLISRSHGSFVFIGEIILNLDLEYNEIPENDFCGSCARCIEACPTRAILDTRTLDAERCISYQTIENKGEILPGIAGKLTNRVFGCDICQDVCPWNRKAIRHRESEFEPTPGLLELSAKEWETMDPGTYHHFFRDSPVSRAGYDKIKATLSTLKKSSDL